MMWKILMGSVMVPAALTAHNARAGPSTPQAL